MSFIHDAGIIDAIGTRVFEGTVGKRTTRVLVIIPSQANSLSALSGIGAVSGGAVV